MPERDNTQTSEQMKEELLESINKAEFDSPQFQAVADFVELNNLFSTLEEVNRMTHSEDSSPERIDSWESSVRITELNIALLQNQISQNKTRVRGYQKAYKHVTSSLDAITEQTLREPENSKKFDDDGAKVYHDLFFTVQEVINEKLDNS